MENFSFRGFVVPVCPGGGHFHYCIVSSTRQQHEWKNRTVLSFFFFGEKTKTIRKMKDSNGKIFLRENT